MPRNGSKALPEGDKTAEQYSELIVCCLEMLQLTLNAQCRILADLCILFSSSRPASRLPPAAAGYQQQTAGYHQQPAGYLVLSVIMPLQKSVEGIL
jgi:hypothetical protein